MRHYPIIYGPSVLSQIKRWQSSQMAARETINQGTPMTPAQKMMEEKYAHMDESFFFVPPHIRDGIKLWVEKGIRPGSFCYSVVCNDLQGAIGRVDHINREHLSSIVAWFYNYAPSGCWGSVENAQAWKGMEND